MAIPQRSRKESGTSKTRKNYSFVSVPILHIAPIRSRYRSGHRFAGHGVFEGFADVVGGDLQAGRVGEWDSSLEATAQG